MKLHGFFKQMAKEFPELNDGIKQRELMAKNLARGDGILLNRKPDELEPIYLDILLNVCTEQMLFDIKSMRPEERLEMADAFQRVGEIQIAPPEHE